MLSRLFILRLLALFQLNITGGNCDISETVVLALFSKLLKCGDNFLTALGTFYTLSSAYKLRSIFYARERGNKKQVGFPVCVCLSAEMSNVAVRFQLKAPICFK